MPRTLPWLKNNGSSSDTKTPLRGRKAEPGSLPHKDFNHTRSSKKDEVQRLSRTPSTSPPPAPPDIEFMVKGDDQWIMVEDELLAAAQSFTTCLHHAEYQRLKKLAMSKRSLTANDVLRPTKPDMVVPKDVEMRVKRRKLDCDTSDALENTGKQKAISAPESSGSESENVMITDRNLAGLMQGRQSPLSRCRIPVARTSTSSGMKAAVAGKIATESAVQERSEHCKNTSQVRVCGQSFAQDRSDKARSFVLDKTNGAVDKLNAPGRQRQATGIDRSKGMHTDTPRAVEQSSAPAPARAHYGPPSMAQDSVDTTRSERQKVNESHDVPPSWKRRKAKSRENAPKKDEIPMFLL